MRGKEWPRISTQNSPVPNTNHDMARVPTQRLSWGRRRPRRSLPRAGLIGIGALILVLVVVAGVFGTAQGNRFVLASPPAPAGMTQVQTPSSTATGSSTAQAGSTAATQSTPASKGQGTPTRTPTPSRGAATYNTQTLIGVGGALPSDAFCASVALAQGDSREAIAANTTPNHDNVNHTGVWNGKDPAQSNMGRVDGSFSGTTDQILVWAACKWGFPADSVRAQAVTESTWHQSQLGDCGVTTQPETHGCPSVGILQVKGADIPPTHPNTWPYAYVSTAWNADYTLSVRRACFDGKISWLRNGYTAGNLWGCIGQWYSGGWLDAGANNYISVVKQHEAHQDWLAYY